MSRVCRRCHAERTPPIEGPCPNCGGLYRTVRARAAESEDDEPDFKGPESAAALLARHGDDPSLALRPTGLRGLDHVFGGGLPAAGTILLSAKEGTGKTSFLFELFLTLAAQQRSALYFPLEQGKQQLVQQFARFGRQRIARAGSDFKIDEQKDLPLILESIRQNRPHVVAIDSAHWVEGVLDDHGQPMKSGTVGAVERVARDVHRLVKEEQVLVFLVGHMNNDGTMAGGHGLRHAVDATLGLQRMTERRRDPRRILRFETKTRFGEMGREALYKMSRDGFKDCGPLDGDLDQDPDEDDEGQDDAAPTTRRPTPRMVN